MYDLANVVTLLQTEHPDFRVVLDKGKEPSFKNPDDPVEVQVSYEAVTDIETLGDGETGDPYVEFDEDLLFHFSVQVNCKVEDVPTIEQSLYETLRGWLPIPSEKGYSGCMLSGGKKKGLANGRIWWIMDWRLEYPRVSTTSF